MAHVSKHKIEEKTRKELENRILSFLSDTSAGTRRFIFKELLTRTERLMIAKRLTMMFLIQKGVTIYGISKYLRVSPSTVARFKNKMERGECTRIQKWIGSRAESSALGKILLDLLGLPFKAQRKSLSQIIREEY